MNNTTFTTESLMDDIAITTSGSNTTVNLTEFMFNYFTIEKPWVVHTGAALTYLVILLNSFVIYVFLKKDNISPSTIPLAALAISDGLTSTLFFLPKHFGYLFNQLEVEEFYYSKGIAYIKPRFPFCVFYLWTFITLSFAFHFVSILITAFLTAQKAVVMAFPFWSRIYMTKRLTILCIMISSLIVISFNIPVGLVYNFTKESDGTCTFTNNRQFAVFFGKVWPKGATIMSVTSVGVIALCTGFICVKLLCLRKSDKNVLTSSSKDKHHRVVLVVVLIAFIFYIFDSMYIICTLYIAATNFEDYSMCNHDYWQYNGLLNVVGFATNYFMYLCVSKRIRHQLLDAMKKLCCFGHYIRSR